MTRRRLAAALRCYPAAWRERYGDELLALVDDELGGRPATWAVTVGLAAAGIRQRLREAGLAGDGPTAADRRRSGALVVLVAWSALVAAGCAFAKRTEHWRDGVPGATQGLPVRLHDAIVVAGAVGSVAVGLAALTWLPTLRGARGRPGWPAARRAVARAAGFVAAATALTVGLAGWAHSLSPAQRNGGSTAYSAAFVCWGLVLAGGLAAVTVAAIRLERCAAPSALQRGIEAVAAVVVALAAAVVTAGIAAWWAVVAGRAPSAITGAGPQGVAWSWPLAAIAVLAVVATTVGLGGAARIVGAGSAPRRPD